MARVLVLDAIGGKGVYEAECNRLQDFYRELRCDCFDIVTRKIGGKYFDIYVDDNGLFAEQPIPSAFDSYMQPMLVGNLVIANHDKHGNTTSLSALDIEKIRKYAVTLFRINDAGEVQSWTALQPVDY